MAASKWINITRVGDCRTLLKGMARDGVRAQVCVTSPPYWGLRSYLADGHDDKHMEMGLEPSINTYLKNIVKVFRLVRNVLADDGIIFVNMGDSYHSSRANGGIGANSSINGRGGQEEFRKASRARHSRRPDQPDVDGPNRRRQRGLKDKDMVGMPWRVAFALQADGWYLRSDIIWQKTQPMPESVTSRPTKAHEYIFMMAKREHYYYDAAAIAEPCSGTAHARGNGVNAKIKIPDGWATHAGGHGSFHKDGREAGKLVDRRPSGWDTSDSDHHQRIGRYPRKQDAGQQTGGGDRMTGFNDRYRARQNASFSAAVTDTVETRNVRTVWTFPTEAQPEAHFATFPHTLAARCILAGSRSGDLILDPFMGSGTTARAATALGRNFTGCELNAEYVAIQQRLGMQVGMAL